MIDVKLAAQSLEKLRILKYFPADKESRAEILALVCEMAETNEQIDWLTRRTRSLWNEWQGPLELRAVFCSRFRPKDGIEACSCLPQFEDGIPSEREAPAIAAPETKRLTAAEVSDAASLRDFIGATARKTDLNRVLAGIPAPKVPDIPIRNGKHGITPEMVAEAEREYREKLARAETGAGSGAQDGAR